LLGIESCFAIISCKDKEVMSYISAYYILYGQRLLSRILILQKLL